jgi:hypothetical protein
LGWLAAPHLRVAQWMKDEMLGPLDSVIESLVSPPSDPMALANRWDGILKSETGFKLDQLVEAVQRWVFDLTQDALAGQIHYHTDWKRPDQSTWRALYRSSDWRLATVNPVSKKFSPSAESTTFS